MTRGRAAGSVVPLLAVLLAMVACTTPDAADGPSSVVVPPASATGTVPSVTPTAPPGTPGPGSPASVRFSVLGDIDDTAASDAVLRSIAQRRDDFTVAVGDLSYGEPGQEEQWCRFVTDRVGVAHPFELVSGNHESDGRNGDIARFAACLPNRLPGIVGTYGRQWFVDTPAAAPLVRVVMISPALDFGHGEWSYDRGTSHHRWLADAVAGARAAGIPWVVVGMHKPCLSLGNYDCDPGTDVVDLLLESGVDLVVTGHEHLYQRTAPLALGPGCPSVRPGSFTAACVTRGPGTTFVTVGTGGAPLRDVHRSDPDAPWFVAASGADEQPSHGSLDVEVTASRLTASFVPVAGGTFTDRVTLSR